MQTTYNGLELPKDGQPIDYKNGQFEVPSNPIIPFIEEMCIRDSIKALTRS